MNPLNRSLVTIAALSIAAVSAVRAQSEPTTLPAMQVYSPRVANQDPAGTFAMPVTTLRFEPAVDVQARNLAEAQADVAIRGGTFANSGFRLAGLALIDPQTGHYAAEIPLAPAMLGAPRIQLGAELALGGSGATAGAVAYDLAPVRSGGFLAGSLGENAYERAELYAAGTRERGNSGEIWGGDFSLAQSSSDGPIADGDHDFKRVSARIQRIGPDGAQTDFIAGHHEKFFGWPNLYTPFNSPETEDLMMSLLMLTHRQPLADEGYFRLSAAYRANQDNYTYNRYAPVPAVLPFEHTTWVRSVSTDGRFVVAPDWTLLMRADVRADEIRSSSLTFGPFTERVEGSIGLFPQYTNERGVGRSWVATAGASYDYSDRFKDAVSPMFELGWNDNHSIWERIYVGYTEATQTPSFTAIASNPAGGLFRGNSALNRSTSRTLETGVTVAAGDWNLNASVFWRQDEDLVDWTFQPGVTARSAAAVDLDTYGVEVMARRSWAKFDLVAGLGWLHKEADYGDAAVYASFYALNFPTTRLTLAAIWRPTPEWQVRWDNEFRQQEDNPLRVNGDDQAALASLGIYYSPAAWPGLQLSVHADNLWDSEFEEVPATPAAPRQLSGGISYRW